MCKKPCESCPFAFTDSSEYAQAMGCLPTQFDILKIKKETDNNWACHSISNKVCQGLTNHLKEKNSSMTTDTGKLHLSDENFGSFTIEPQPYLVKQHNLFPMLLELNGKKVIKKSEFERLVALNIKSKENINNVYE